MTTLNPLLARPTHPQRKPFVRSHTFVDGVGPPPYSFFDETQDHVGALYHAALGWKWSLDSDEFTETGARPGFLGRMRIIISSGIAVAPKTTGLAFGEHGVWEARSGAGAFSIRAGSANISLGGDFLATAKVMLLGRERLDRGGFSAGVAGCAFLAGSGFPFWRVTYVTEPGTFAFAETDIPVLDNVWYRLQVSRLAGAVRWHVNGQLARVGGREGVPSPLRLDTDKLIFASRSAPGPAGDGFAIDSFHLLAERT
jgi:hypothetical protein